MASKREISAVELYDYGHEILGLTRQIEACLGKCYNASDPRNATDFGELQDAIRKLHDLLNLSLETSVPASFSHPPRPQRTQYTEPPPDEIPF
jgi:hypothetical protein